MADYEHTPGLLRIGKDLGWALEAELRDHCRRLLDSGASKIAVDLSRVNHVCSSNLVAFAYLGAVAQKDGKHLTMIVNARVARSLEVAGFGEFATLQVQG